MRGHSKEEAIYNGSPLNKPKHTCALDCQLQKGMKVSACLTRGPPAPYPLSPKTSAAVCSAWVQQPSSRRQCVWFSRVIWAVSGAEACSSSTSVLPFLVVMDAATLRGRGPAQPVQAPVAMGPRHPKAEAVHHAHPCTPLVQATNDGDARDVHMRKGFHACGQRNRKRRWERNISRVAEWEPKLPLLSVKEL